MSNEQINIPEVVRLVANSEDFTVYDAASDILPDLDENYKRYLPFLYETLSGDASEQAKEFALDAIEKIDPYLKTSVSSVIAMLNSDSDVLREKSAVLLRHCPPDHRDQAITALTIAVRKINSDFGAITAEFITLKQLVGCKRALKLTMLGPKLGR